MSDDCEDGRDDRTTILVVDDDADVRRAVSRILRHEGHSVIEAADGETAVELGRQHQPEVVVLDYMLPGMDGPMILDALRAALSDRPPIALLLTGCGDEAVRAAEMGADQGLGKPFRVEELVEAVDRHLQDERRKAS